VIVARRNFERAAPYLLSILFHVLLLIAIVLLPRIETFISPPEQTLSVEIVTSEQFREISESGKTKDEQIANPVEAGPAPVVHGEANALPEPPRPRALGPQAVETEAPGTWHTAIKILSVAALSDPRNKKAKAALPTLETSTRYEQLCNFEAVLQIRQKEVQFRPELVIAYAMAAARLSADVVTAEGAAFQSQGRWYNLAFKCRISPRQQKVLAFEFAIGAAIPRSEWASHYLPASSQGAGD
jgi:hypothetical protein